MSQAIPDVRALYVEAARVAVDLLADPRVATRWNESSALHEWTVAGLAGHLGRVVLVVDHYLGTSPSDLAERPVSPVEYYADVFAVEDLSDPLHESIRMRGDEQAAGGRDALVERTGEALARLESTLSKEPPDRKVKVFGDMVMFLDDYLMTRLIETVVHCDDLAVSVDIEPPEFDAPTMDVVIGSLVAMARVRRGDLAIVRALARRERDDVDALRLF